MNSKPRSPDLVRGIAERRDRKESWLAIGRAYHMDPNTVRDIARDAPSFPPHLLEDLPAPKRQVATSDIREWVEDLKMTDRQIAEKLGMSAESFARLRSRRGIKRGEPVRNPPVAAEKWVEVEALLDEGYSFTAASQISGVGTGSITKRFPGRGFTHEQTVEASLMARKLKRVAA